MTAAQSRPKAPATDEAAPPSLAVVKPAEALSVATVRHAVVNFAASHGAPHSLLGDIALAVSEATTNAVKHANVAAGEGIVEVTATVADAWLDIRVRDRGKGFGTRRSDGLGLGLSLIASVAGRLMIRQEGHGTEVRMGFPLPRLLARQQASYCD